MSYDIRLCDDGVTLEGDTHDMRGGTSAEAWLNVTYNYAPHYYRTMGEKGIRSIYGMTGSESVPVLSAAIDGLGTDRHSDYWEPTEGNARVALEQLRELALRHPNGRWEGD